MVKYLLTYSGGGAIFEALAFFASWASKSTPVKHFSSAAAWPLVWGKPSNMNPVCWTIATTGAPFTGKELKHHHFL